jgi:predicted GH43/DUF377 family glycosyl hydrolase
LEVRIMKKILFAIAVVSVLIIVTGLPGMGYERIVKNSVYRGITILRPNNWDYAPAVIYDENKYKMWWCGSWPGARPGTGDHILYAESQDGLRWSDPIVALKPGPQGHPDSVHVCDPAVVRVNGKYYMYYTGATVGNGGNAVFLATSDIG